MWAFMSVTSQLHSLHGTCVASRSCRSDRHANKSPWILPLRAPMATWDELMNAHASCSTCSPSRITDQRRPALHVSTSPTSRSKTDVSRATSIRRRKASDAASTGNTCTELRLPTLVAIDEESDDASVATPGCACASPSTAMRQAG